MDSSCTLWVGRQKQRGIGETRSNLEFDRLLNLGNPLYSTPEIDSIMPFAAIQGQDDVIVTIRGRGLTGISQVEFDDIGIITRILPGGNDLSVQVALSIRPTVAFSYQAFEITTPGGVANSEDFNKRFIVYTIPEITGISSKVAQRGETKVIRVC